MRITRRTTGLGAVAAYLLLSVTASTTNAQIATGNLEFPNFTPVVDSSGMLLDGTTSPAIVSIGSFIGFNPGDIRGFLSAGTLGLNFTTFGTVAFNSAPGTDGTFLGDAAFGAPFLVSEPLVGSVITALIELGNEFLVLQHPTNVLFEADGDLAPFTATLAFFDGSGAPFTMNVSSGPLVVGFSGVSISTNFGSFAGYELEVGATPIPEPSTYLLMAIGGIMAIFGIRRRIN